MGLNFPSLDFPHSNIKKAGISKLFFSFSTLSYITLPAALRAVNSIFFFTFTHYLTVWDIAPTFLRQKLTKLDGGPYSPFDPSLAQSSYAQ